MAPAGNADADLVGEEEVTVVIPAALVAKNRSEPVVAGLLPGAGRLHRRRGGGF